MTPCRVFVFDCGTCPRCIVVLNKQLLPFMLLQSRYHSVAHQLLSHRDNIAVMTIPPHAHAAMQCTIAASLMRTMSAV
jgi:hypothetical protein